MDKKENMRLKTKRLIATTAVPNGESNPQDYEDRMINRRLTGALDTLASLVVILRDVKVSQRERPQEALSVILSRFLEVVV